MARQNIIRRGGGGGGGGGHFIIGNIDVGLGKFCRNDTLFL